MKLSDYAKKHNCTYRTAWNRYKAGKIPNSYELNGHIYIDETKKYNDKSVVIYARVSSNENKSNLDSQADRLYQYAIARGYKIVEIIKEVGSGVNDNRKKLQKLLSSEKDFSKIIVEHKDRLTRFGFNYIETLLKINGRQIEVVNCNEDEKHDIVQDLISIIYSFSAKLYGLRRSKRKTEEIIKILQDKDEII